MAAPDRGATSAAGPRGERPGRARLVSVDALRGLVMVLMALDHARHFASRIPPVPEDMRHTDLALFLTRWVTHFCAPLFFLLAGVAAWLHGARAGRPALRRFLVTRGLWLIALELTVIGFAWNFQPGYSLAGVIWCLGWSFLFLAALLSLGTRTVLVVGTALALLHGLGDDLGQESFGRAGFLYGLLHQAGGIEFPWGGHWFVLFPLVPWVGVMALGYGLGPLFAREPAARGRVLLWLGGALCAVFVLLRATNAYGNPSWAFQPGGPGHFAPQESLTKSVIAFLNTEKYPPSLQYLLMTLGPGLLGLGWLARRDGGEPLSAPLRVLVLFGRTPFLFYLLHLYAFHLSAWALTASLGQPAGWLGFGGGRRPPEFGLGLAGVYALWLGVTALLWGPCARWAALRARRDEWWLKYL